MSAGGHMMDFNKRMKANRDLRKKRLRLFDLLDSYEKSPFRKLKLKNFSKAQVEAFLLKWRSKKAEEDRKTPFLIIGSILIALVFILALVKIAEAIFL